jgi:transposase InsO family protein
MPSDFKRVRYLRPKYSQKSYHMLMKMMQDSLSLEVADVAAFRLHILIHYEKYGLRPTLEAFKIKKSSLYNWRNAYRSSHRHTSSLVPKQTRPVNVRKMETDWRLVAFIKSMRKEHGNIGKNMLKPFIDAYAKEIGIPSIGLTTIAKVIKRRQLTFEKKVYPQKQPNKFRKLRVRKSPKVTKPGFIEMDCVVVYINYEKHLFMCVMDIFTKYALVTYVPTLSSAQAREVFKQFQKNNPTSIHTVQTDNGSEFLKSFHAYLEEQKIKHQFIYPRMPKINSFIERFNRTIQEEFILRNDEIYYDQKAFAKKLTKYLYWYNYQRPHASLHYMSPMNFIATKIPIST